MRIVFQEKRRAEQQEPGEGDDERSLVDAFSSGARDSVTYTRGTVVRLLIAILRRHGITAQVRTSVPIFLLVLVPSSGALWSRRFCLLGCSHCSGCSRQVAAVAPTYAVVVILFDVNRNVNLFLPLSVCLSSCRGR